MDDRYPNQSFIKLVVVQAIRGFEEKNFQAFMTMSLFKLLQKAERKFLLITFILNWLLWLFMVWVFYKIDGRRASVGEWLIKTTIMALIMTMANPVWSKLKGMFRKRN